LVGHVLLLRLRAKKPFFDLQKEKGPRRIAASIAKLPVLLGAADHSGLDFPEGGG
jgi:hypothetical protein